MKKYIDLIAYPLMFALVYALVGFVSWESSSSEWTWNARAVTVMWGVCWGWALALRIKESS